MSPPKSPPKSATPPSEPKSSDPVSLASVAPASPSAPVAGRVIEATIVVEERLGDGGADEAPGQHRQEHAAEPEPGARATAPGALDRARLADLGPRRRAGQRRGIIAADLAFGHVLGERLERLSPLVGREPGERLFVGALDFVRWRRGEHVAVAGHGLLVGGWHDSLPAVCVEFAPTGPLCQEPRLSHE